MLELGKVGTAGAPKRVLPVLRDGVLVATLQASNWKEQATAVVGDRRWEYGKRKGVLTARWESEPEDAVRLQARQTSWWKDSWEVQLPGRTVQVRYRADVAAAPEYPAKAVPEAYRFDIRAKCAP